MRQAHIASEHMSIDFARAARLAAAVADQDREVIEPVLVAWYDRAAARMSPVIEGADLNYRWRDYGTSHGGRLEVDVGDDYAFIYAESSAFDGYEACPFCNLFDDEGNEYLCQINLLDDAHRPNARACVPLDEWTSKLT
jgi:hypothetical protein